MTKWEKLFFGVLAVGLIVFLDGCATVKTVYDTCREGLCR